MALPYATEDQLNKVEKKLLKKINAGGGTSGEIPTKLSQLTNDTGFITTAALTDYALKSELPDLSSYALKTELPDVSNFATKEEVTGVEDKIPDITPLATKEELEDGLQFKPVICNMNFRTLSDKVYTQDEIFAWFFVKDIFELKDTIIKHPIYLRYGISLSTNPMYYYIPCQYVAFTDANTVEMITDGLDTKNDKFSRYQITIKLDGTVINGASNIKVELKENLFVPDLPEDADSKTYQLKAVNGKLNWVE